MPNNNSSNTNSYMTGSGSVRIRTPHPSDVLLGRGGGINSHVGNKVFRDWVHERKEDYNLAGSKAEKTRVAKEVMALVTDKGGRFLQKDPSSSMSSGWWVEVDELRALAKTSQALREGAPQIRAAHQDEKPATRKRKSSRGSKGGGGGGSSRTGSSKASTTTSPSGWPQTVPPAPPSDNNNENMPHHREVPSGTQQALNELGRNLLEAKSLAAKSVDKPHQTATLPSYSRPLMSNKEFQQQQQLLQQQVDEEPSSNKKPRVESNNGSSMYVYTETPPLTYTISPPMVVPPPIPAPAARGANNNFMHRAHSLALSDISGGWVPDSSSAAEDLAEDFVNPFLDESDLVLLHPSWPSTSSRTPEPSPRPTPPATIIAPTQPQQQQQQEPAYQSPARTQLNSNDNSTRVGGMVRNVSSASDAGREEYRQLGELYGLPPSGSWSSSMNNIPTIQLMSNDHHHRSLSTSSSGNNDSNYNNNNNDTYSPRGNNNNNNNNNSHGIRDFNEELRSIMDAVHPEDDITTPPLNGKEPPNGINIGMPTLLLPWRGGALQRRYGSSGALKKTSSSSGSNGAERQ